MQTMMMKPWLFGSFFVGAVAVSYALRLAI